ncbi:uncharacterized protein [Parasteatoda tepidariorum]|uniref:uncharacterized protein n=1 Tax=Parasteatoda tepidariorum TaxID=114398 RepID=UPI001C722881|nr:E3 ubiquitin-protein ligase CHFR-like [Parasteatoda tepidariorum]
MKDGVSTSISTRYQCITCLFGSFSAPTGNDAMMKAGVSTSIDTRHQCVTCREEYIHKRWEEARRKLYAKFKKGGGAAPGLGFGNTTQTTGGLFGAPDEASTSAFSFGNTTAQSKPRFSSTGGMTNNTFRSTGEGTQKTQNARLFSKSVGFGDPSTSTAPAFNFGSTDIALFPQKNQQKLEKLKAKQEKNAKDDFKKLIEDELICNICTEILIKPITLGCSHTFCKFCISEWKEQKGECPMCRASIKTEIPCLFLDNFISKAVEQIDPASVVKRLEIIKCREEEQKKNIYKPPEQPHQPSNVPP